MKTRSIILAAILIVIFSLVIWNVSSGGSNPDSDIYVAPVKGEFEVIVTTTGELRAKNSIEIKGPSAQLMRLNLYRIPIADLIPEGTVVDSGDYVARLDKNDLQSKIQETGLTLEQAKSQYTQAKLDSALALSKERNEIVNLHFTMDERQAEIEQSVYEAPATQRKVQLEYDKAKRAYEQAVSNYQKQIALQVAKVKEKESEMTKEQNNFDQLLSLEKQFTITAPSNGMVIYYREWGGRKRTVGSNMDAWNPIVATLPDLTVMESVTYVNEIDIQKIKKDQTVSIGLDAMPNKELTGKITSVANIGEQRPNSDSKVFEVIIRVNEADTTLRPAMTTSNEILVDKIPDALYIPLECLHARDSISYVFKKDGGKTIRQEVITGLMNENDAEIISGITEDDQLFLSMPEDTSRLKWTFLSDKEVIATNKTEN